VFDQELVQNLSQYCDVVYIDKWKTLKISKVDAIVGHFSNAQSESSRVLQRAMLATAAQFVSYSEFMEELEGRVSIQKIPSLRNFSVETRLNYLLFKRILDFVFALVIVGPCLAVSPFIAVAIKFSSPGPILFSQTRMGFRGRPFTMYKFRTMRVEVSGSHFTSDIADHRITSVGHILRKTRLDEIPQLWNILKGEMSWIGPRPESLPLAKWYCRDVPLFRVRHLVRPGISGWAQVNQGYAAGVEDVSEKVRYDLYYIKHLSFWLDLVILFKTIVVMLSGRGAR